MNRNLYIAGAAFAVTCVTAALVIIIARPGNTRTAAPVATATATATATTFSTSQPVSRPAAASAPQSSQSPPRTSTQPAEPRVTVPKLPAAQQSDPLAVAQTAVATLYSVDPAVDRDGSQAARRAAYLLTPQLAAALTAPQTTGSDPQWQTWADSDAYVTVTSKKIAIAWTVADNRLQVVRNIGFIRTVHTKASAIALQQQTLAVTLVRKADGGPWRVDSMETP